MASAITRIKVAVELFATAITGGNLKAILQANSGVDIGDVGIKAGENHVGSMGGKTGIVASSLIMSVAGAYATGDYIGRSTTPQSFAGIMRTNGGTGVVKSLVINDKLTTAAVNMELWLFSITYTAPTDNAAWSISDADNTNCIGVIDIPANGWKASALNKTYTDDSIALPVTTAAQDIFYALVARGTTPTWATLDLQLTLTVLQD